jgi:hypothetical protein
MSHSLRRIPVGANDRDAVNDSFTSTGATNGSFTSFGEPPCSLR